MRDQKILISAFLAALLVCSFFTGCSAREGSTAARGMAWDLSGAEPEYLTQWPDNAFTEKIVQPQSGTIDHVLDYTDSGRYAIFIRDISLEESEQYVKALKGAGYAEMHSAGNNVSVGRMLESDEAYLSVSYSDDVLGVVITLKEKTN